MQDAADASTAFGRIRSFESILEDIDQPPGNVKPQAKKEPKKKNKAAGKTKKLPQKAAPESHAAESHAAPDSDAAPASIKKRPAAYKSTAKSRLYSGAYHKEYNKAIRSGKGRAAARLVAGVVGRAAAAAAVKTAAAAAAAAAAP